MLLNAKFTPFHQGFKPNSRFQMSQRMSAYGKRVSARRDAQRSSDSSQKRLLIDSLNPHDVVLGRGQHVKHEGNTSFRTLVRSRAAEYHVCCKNSKDLIAREIVRVVEDLGGRFVRRTECSEDASTMVKRSTWELADRSNVLVKVKQTFRDYSVMQRKAASAAASATAWASQSSGTHDSISPPSLHLAARPNDHEPPAVQPPSSLNNSAIAFTQPSILSTHQNLIAQQDQSNIGHLISTLASQPLSQQSLGNYTIPHLQSGPAIQSVLPPSIGSEMSNASDISRSWTPEQFHQLQTILWQQILSNGPTGIVGELSNLAPPSSVLQQSLLEPQILTLPLIAGTNWSFPTTLSVPLPSALFSTLSSNALASWNAALGALLGGAQVSAAATQNGHVATTTTTAMDQSSGNGNQQFSSQRVSNV
jgi:hypothetical protein